MTPSQYCEEKTRGAGSSFFYAFIFLPEKQRRAMMALYAFCREVDDIADEVSDQDVASAKLAFWRDEVMRALAGRATHPVGKELYWASQHYSLDEELFMEILDGMLMDIQRQPIQKWSDLSLYAYRVAGAVGLLSIEVFGYTSRQSRNFAIQLGEALQLTNILRDLAEDVRRGRFYIPQEDRIRFNVRDQDLIDGNLDENVRCLLQHYTEKAESSYQQSLASLPAADRESLRPSLVMAQIYLAQLKRIKKINFDVWRNSAHITPLHKIWIAWLTWRRERKLAGKPSSKPQIRT